MEHYVFICLKCRRLSVCLFLCPFVGLSIGLFVCLSDSADQEEYMSKPRSAKRASRTCTTNDENVHTSRNYTVRQPERHGPSEHSEQIEEHSGTVSRRTCHPRTRHGHAGRRCGCARLRASATNVSSASLASHYWWQAPGGNRHRRSTAAANPSKDDNGRAAARKLKKTGK